MQRQQVVIGTRFAQIDRAITARRNTKLPRARVETFGGCRVRNVKCHVSKRGYPGRIVRHRLRVTGQKSPACRAIHIIAVSTTIQASDITSPGFSMSGIFQ